MKKISVLTFLASTLFALSCRKNPANEYANKMNGVHKWHGAYDYTHNSSSGPATTDLRAINDTTVEIQVYENYIVFGNTSMSFESLNNTNHTIRYSLNDASTLSFYSVTYYYEADSITYRFSQTLGIYGSEYLNLKTP